jgi:hypothetical protein
MIYKIIDEIENFRSAALIGTLAELWKTNQLLLSDKPFHDWKKLVLRNTDPLLPEPDFMFLNLTGLFLVKERTIKSVQDLFLGSEFLPVSFNNEDWLIVKPPTCAGYLDIEKSIISYDNVNAPILSTPVFISNIPPVPWFFRAQYSILLYTTDGPGSFKDWYESSRLTGLKFIPQNASSGCSVHVSNDRALSFRDDSELDFSPVISTRNAEIGATAKEAPSTLELRDYESIVHPHLLGALNKFCQESNGVRVCAIEINFDIDPGGYYINIDTRDKYIAGTSDGMKYSNFSWLVIDQWYDFKCVMMSSKCSLITYTGDVLEFAPAEDGYQLVSGCATKYETDEPDAGHLIMALGEFFTLMMKKLISQGVFDKWNLTPNARFYVSTSEEEFHTLKSIEYQDTIINPT